ncbi:MAG: hypothetical protein PHD60_10905 [Clostridia bacterium]|nr:hypothetical protein [Clostridia bacterium]
MVNLKELESKFAFEEGKTYTICDKELIFVGVTRGKTIMWVFKSPGKGLLETFIYGQLLSDKQFNKEAEAEIRKEKRAKVDHNKYKKTRLKQEQASLSKRELKEKELFE